MNMPQWAVLLWVNNTSDYYCKQKQQQPQRFFECERMGDGGGGPQKDYRLI